MGADAQPLQSNHQGDSYTWHVRFPHTAGVQQFEQSFRFYPSFTRQGSVNDNGPVAHQTSLTHKKVQVSVIMSSPKRRVQSNPLDPDQAIIWIAID